jgi:hypothetical protein
VAGVEHYTQVQMNNCSFHQVLPHTSMHLCVDGKTILYALRCVIYCKWAQSIFRLNGRAKRIWYEEQICPKCGGIVLRHFFGPSGVKRLKAAKSSITTLNIFYVWTLILGWSRTITVLHVYGVCGNAAISEVNGQAAVDDAWRKKTTKMNRRRHAI